MKVSTPRWIPTATLLEWAENNKLIYIRAVDVAKANVQHVEAAYYQGGLDMMTELIFIISHLKEQQPKQS